MALPSSPKNDFRLKCLATTGDRYCRSIAQTQTGQKPRSRGVDEGSQSNFFREAQFSRDGTTIITHNEDQCLRTYVLPPELLEVEQEPRSLESYSSFAASSNIQSYAIYPGYHLQEASTTLVLSANAGQPLRLGNALHLNTVHAKYNLIKQTTEEYLKASSLTFTVDGHHFIAGSVGMISVFDTHIDGSGPIVQHQTNLKRSGKSSGLDVPSMRKGGIVSALSVNCDALLAVGTTEREIALYANEGQGECTTSFSVRPLQGDTTDITGHGITKVAWSPCGTYLLVAERQSDGVQVYDVRNTFQRVSWLSGRCASTPQRLGIDVVPTASGYEVWGGGTDGCVRMWMDPGVVGGVQYHDGLLEMHDDPVSSTIWHPQGAVVATCSGKRFDDGFDFSEDESEHGISADSNPETTTFGVGYKTMIGTDNTLRIWTV